MYLKTKHKLLISVALITVGILVRLMPHIWNVAPIAAIALISAVYLGRTYAFVVPITALFLGDLFLGFYDIGVMIAVYVSFGLIGFIGLWIKRKKDVTTVVLASLSASILFFLISNWAVWQFTPWYDKSILGLIEAYTLAIPFFRNTIVGDLVYTGTLFAVFEFSRVYFISKQTSRLVSVKETI